MSEMSVPYMIDYPAAYERVCQQLAEANAKIAELKAKLEEERVTSDEIILSRKLLRNEYQKYRIDTEAAVEGFRRRAVEVIETSMFEYTCKSGVTRKDMTEAIESLPAFETKGETK